jgi:2-enoate reductase
LEEAGIVMATRAEYSKLLMPIKIGGVEIRNRGAMGDFFLTNVDGSFSQRCVDYFIERARGGVGLIVTGVCQIENEIEPISPSAGSPRLQRLCCAVARAL